MTSGSRDASMDSLPSVALIVPAAGEGARLGLALPKALAMVNGISLVRRSVERFDALPELAEIVVAAPAAHGAAFEAVFADRAPDAVRVRIVPGGATRQESVEMALRSIESAPVLVCVHDAARPLVSAGTIRSVLGAASRSGAATAASRPADSVRAEAPGSATRALDRSTVWMVETPQAFAFALLRDAHARARAQNFKATDDAALAEAMCGVNVSVVASEGPNTKVTTQADLQLVTLLCR
jgi:2-C-methyl-D-erythritol 4-phosphate cytidylyltransferase